MADFAAPLFWGKALSWHLRLPQDVRQDWFKLEIALADRWPSPEDEDEPVVQPIPAAAPSLNRNNNSNRPLQGVLKVVFNGSNTEYYVKGPDSDSECRLTSLMVDALRVRWNSSSSATPLEAIDHSSHSWLVVQWKNLPISFKDGSTDYAIVTCPNPDTLKFSSSAGALSQLLTCLISANGRVIPIWKKLNSAEVTLFPFINNTRLYLVLDPEPYSQRYPSEKQAKLFIEPID